MCGRDIDGGVQGCGPVRVLELVSVTHHFAPGARGEKATAEYNIENMRDDRITFDVLDRDGRLVFQRQLSWLEKGKPVFGLKSIDWDGTLADGTLAGPRSSPYRVRLTNQDRAIRSDALETHVLVHSLELELGPWDTQQRWGANSRPPGGADHARWVRFKLDSLGYFGGPVDADQDGYQQRAITRYRANHARMAQAVYADYAALMDVEAWRVLDAALQANDNPRPWLTKPQGQGRRQLAAGDALVLGGQDVLRVHVEQLWWMGTRGGPLAPIGVNETEHQYPNPDEPGATTRMAHDQARLNRPLVPIEAVIHLLGSDGRPKRSPRAVGGVQVVWSHTEPHEDLTRQHADRADVCSYPRRYIERALQLDGGRVGNTGNNCQTRFGGIRGGSSPLVAGASYAPYDGNAAGTTVRMRAYAQLDQPQYERCIGRAGIWFRPSTIGGDRYRVEVAIDLADLDPAQPAVSAQTSPLEVWRTLKVAAVVGWPARDLSAFWAAVRQEYAAAYVDLDTSAVATLAITELFDDHAYVDWLQTAMGDNYDAVFPGTFHERLSRDAMFTSDDEDPGMFFVMVTGENVLDMLGRKLGPRVRARYPQGLICVTHRVGVAEQNPPAVSISLENGIVLLDHATPGAGYHIVAHEMGHCLWLHHGRQTLRNHVDHPQAEMYTEHDPADLSCIMDYTKDDDVAHPHRHADRYAPHFCGKCNLKLRGWHVLPVGAGNELPMDGARIVAAEWGAC